MITINGHTLSGVEILFMIVLYIVVRMVTKIFINQCIRDGSARCFPYFIIFMLVYTAILYADKLPDFEKYEQEFKDKFKIQLNEY